MEQLLGFILILIFFIGPALRKLFEGNQTNRSQRSREEIKKYLERMRNLQEQSQQTQQNSYSNYKSNNDIAEESFEAIEVKDHFGDFDRISRSVEEDVVKHVEDHITGHSYDIKKTKRTASDEASSGSRKNNLEEYNYDIKESKKTSSDEASSGGENKIKSLIFDNENYNDLQKAFLLGEIFNKPRGLQDI